MVDTASNGNTSRTLSTVSDHVVAVDPTPTTNVDQDNLFVVDADL